MSYYGEPVHGELIVDGNASTLTVLVLYPSGSTTARTLASDEWLNITDVEITNEVAGDIVLVADSAAAARYIVSAGLGATSGIVLHFVTPYVCPKGVVPKFAGATSGRSSCIIQGYITKA